MFWVQLFMWTLKSLTTPFNQNFFFGFHFFLFFFCFIDHNFFWHHLLKGWQMGEKLGQTCNFNLLFFLNECHTLTCTFLVATTKKKRKFFAEKNSLVLLFFLQVIHFENCKFSIHSKRQISEIVNDNNADVNQKIASFQIKKKPCASCFNFIISTSGF